MREPCFNDTIGSFLDKIYYENLNEYKSREGHRATYNLDLILYKQFKLFEIPGTGIAFVVNPSSPENLIGGTQFNCSLEYRLEILKYLKGFKLSNFDFSLTSFVKLFQSSYVISDFSLFKETIYVFIDNLDTPSEAPDPLEVFIDNYNSKYEPEITSYSSIEDAYNQIIANHNIIDIILNDYLENKFEKLGSLLATWLGPLDKAKITSLIIPHIKASINTFNHIIVNIKSVYQCSPPCPLP